MAKNSYTTHQVSKFCDVYPTTVIKWIKEGILPAFTTPGGHRRIQKEDIRVLMEKNNMPIPGELARDDKYGVLAIDDDQKILKMIKTILSAEDNLDIRTAASGFEAGIIIGNWEPDIILLDFLMPKVDGFEVCKRLRSDEKTKDIPVIAVTVLKEEKERTKMKHAGITDYLSKPFKASALLQIIRMHLHIEKTG